MPIETQPSIEKDKKNDDKSLVEHLVELRNIVGRVMSGNAEGGMVVSGTVGHRRFDPQNQTARSTVVSDDSTTSDDPNDDNQT